VKKIVFAVMGLLALFTILRSYGQSASGGTRYVLEPGVLEIDTAEGSARIAFAAGARRGTARTWSLFPIRGVLLRQRLALALNGWVLLSLPACRSAGPCASPGRSRGT
jgi:hypothetical protein